MMSFGLMGIVLVLLIVGVIVFFVAQGGGKDKPQ